MPTAAASHLSTFRLPALTKASVPRASAAHIEIRKTDSGSSPGMRARNVEFKRMPITTEGLTCYGTMSGVEPQHSVLRQEEGATATSGAVELLSMPARHTPIWLIAFLVTAIALGGVAGADDAGRPSLGFLPFQPDGSDGPGLAFAAPGLISWELFYIPGLDQVPLRRMERCRQIDRLRRPASLEDERAWSRLAVRLGVDYLVTGTVRRAARDTLQLNLYLFPAQPGAPVTRLAYRTEVASLPAAAERAARDVARAVGVEPGERRSGREKAEMDALKAIDTALRLQMAPDGDISDVHRAIRFLEGALDDVGVGVFARALRSIPWSRGDRESTRELMRRAPDNLMVLSEMAVRRLQMGADERARSTITRWAEADPTSHLSRIAASGSHLPNDDRERAAAFAALRNLAPKNQSWRMMLTTAEVLAAAGDLEGTAIAIEKAKEEHPTSAYIRVVAGQIYMSKGRHPAGRAEYQAAAKINPGSYILQIALAGAYFQEGDAENALKLAEQIRSRWPDKSEGHRLAARLHLRNGDQERAVKAYEAVRRLDPDGDIDSEDLAAHYLRSGRILDGVRELARGREEVKRFLVLSSLVLTGVFLLAAVGVAVAVRAALSRDRGAGR